MYFNQADLWLELTSRCRLECIKCDRTPLINKMVISDLDVSVFEKLAKSGNFKSMLFCGTYGDCIYHPKFKQIVKIAKQNDISLVIHTNGSGKKIEWWVEILEMLDPLKDAIYIAMDGFNETAGMYRINFKQKDFDRNIEMMSLAANKYKLKVIWIYIPMNFNELYIEQAAKLAIKNNIIFCIKKSVRWNNIGDKMLPYNPKLISKNSRVGRLLNR